METMPSLRCEEPTWTPTVDFFLSPPDTTAASESAPMVQAEGSAADSSRAFTGGAAIFPCYPAAAAKNLSTIATVGMLHAGGGGEHAAWCNCAALSFRESVLFIGTQFSILYTVMYSPA